MPAVAPQAPSGLDADPSAYLAQPRFNSTLDFTFAGQPATASYALTLADDAWPVLVLFNGLGGHRLIAALIEGIARAHRVQVLTLDKPGVGTARPTSLPLAHRTRWAHAALLAVLAHLRIPRFALLSHSNGIFYALHTLLHLPAGLTASSWTLTGPFVPQTISGAAGLRLAAMLPAPLPNALGSLLQVVPAVSWSAGLLSASAGFLAGGGKGEGGVDAREAKEALKPVEEREYMYRSVSDACRAATMRIGMSEARAAMGQEALLGLHGGDPAPALADDADGPESVWGIGPGANDAEVLRTAFKRLAERYPGGTLKMRVVYGAADGMVPKKGREWLKRELEEAGLIGGGEDAWTEVPKAGHDDVLFLEGVMGGIFGRVGSPNEETSGES